ncbi:MAG TPA: DUF1116 domain-containing protein [bacterium]|nr:DUF1116 domain-containing protein [bacterium]
MATTTDEINRAVLERLHAAEPVLEDVLSAGEVVPGFGPRTALHAGPAVAWDEMCGPLRGAVVGALRLEGWAETETDAVRLIQSGDVTCGSAHDHGAVGPMAGVITPSMPVFVVRNRAFGNIACCTINEGIGSALRFGANDASVLDRLRWFAATLGPGLGEAVRGAGGMDLRTIMARALTMGDELHQRNVAATSLFVRALAPHLERVGMSADARGRIFEFLSSNDQFFLNLAMAAAKASADPMRNVPGCTLVTAMARNGTVFGIRVSGTADRWFTAPSPVPQGLLFPGFTEADCNPDLGDSAITETIGLGGVAMAASPAVVRFVGGASVREALAVTREMGEICAGTSPYYRVPALEFAGVPTGIDVRRVVATGIAPVINTGIAHRRAGVGQVGAGTVRAPLGAFRDAVAALAAAR